MNTHQYKIVAAFLVIYVVWGTTFLGIRIAVETIPAFTMAGLRFTSAGGLMLAVLLAMGGRFPSRLHWRSAAIVGGLMLGGGIGLVSYAEERIASGLAALVAATIPIWMNILEWLIFGGKKPTTQTFIGLGLGFIGAVLLFAPALTSDNAEYDLGGMAIAFTGAFIFALGSLYSRRAPFPDDTRISTASEMLAGGLILFVMSILAGEPSRVEVSQISQRSLFAVLYLSLIGSILGYTAYLWLLKHVDPAKVSTNFYVNPVVAVFMGWLVLDETVTATMILAAGIILFGVAVMNFSRPKRKETLFVSDGHNMPADA